MDYEFRIQLLEKDLAHYREMQAIVRERLDTDTHDTHLGHVNTFIAGTSERLDKIEELVHEMAKNTIELQQVLHSFIDSMRKGNGQH